MARIFISHSSRDNSAASNLRAWLEEQGQHSVFLDFDPDGGIGAAEQWERTLYRKLRSCETVIVLCSDHSMKSHWCFAEMAIARMEGKSLFGLKIDPLSAETVIPSLLTEGQMVDLRSDQDAGLGRLWEGLGREGISSSPDWDRSRPPYPGMTAFQEDDEAVFFGRHDEKSETLEKLKRVQRLGFPRLVMVMGPSGSGKSSLVRAGVVPALRRHGDDWHLVGPFKPGSEPTEELAAALAEAFDTSWQEVYSEIGSSDDLGVTLRRFHRRSQAKNGHLLVVVDQFEELLGHPADHPANSFLARLRPVLDHEGSSLMVLGTMRSDYLGAFHRQPSLRGVRLESVSLGPMGPSSLRATIEQPARLAELELEPGLVDELLKDTGSSEALSLLAFTLRELWDQSRGDQSLDAGRLTTEGYVRLGRLHGSVARVADDIAGEDKLTAEQAEALRTAFVTKLVRVDESGQFLRRTTSWNEISDVAKPLIERFVRARLLVSRDREGGDGDRVIEVAHEALFSSWQRLSEWLRDERGFLLWRQRLARDLGDWERTDCDPGALVRGSKLAEAESWLARRPEGLGVAQQAYVRESVESRDRHATQTRVTQAASAVEDPLLQALLLSEVSPADEPPGGFRLARSVAESVIPSSVLYGHRGHVFAAVFSPDSRQVATASADRTVRVWNADGSGRPIVLSGHDEAVRICQFSPAGDRIISGSDDGTVRIWNADGSGAPLLLTGHERPVVGAAYSADGTRIVTASYDGTSRIWNADGSGEPRVLRHPLPVTCAAFDPAGSRIATGSRDAKIRIWSADGSGGPTVLEGHLRTVYSVVFTPDGSGLVTASSDHTVRVWDLDGSGEPVTLRRHAEVNWADLDPDGQRLVSASDDDIALIGNADGTGESLQLRGHRSWVLGAFFSPDGRHVATASKDGTARVWPATGPTDPAILHRGNVAVNDLAFNSNGTRVAAVLDDGTLRVWSAEGESGSTLIGTLNGPAYAVCFSPNDSRLVAASADGGVRMWRTDGSMEIPLADPGQGTVFRSVVFHRDGRFLCGGEDGSVVTWATLDGGAPLSIAMHEGVVWSVAFGPEGSILTASNDCTARVWSLGGGPNSLVLEHDQPVLSAAYSEDGSQIATSSADGRVRVWNVDHPRDPTVLEHDGAVWCVRFSPDGARLVSASDDRTVRIWSADGSGEPIELRGHASWVNRAVFNPDGSQIASASGDGTLRLWRATWASLVEHLRRCTNACLTSDDRVRYLAESPQEAMARHAECERAYGRAGRGYG